MREQLAARFRDRFDKRRGGVGGDRRRRYAKQRLIREADTWNKQAHSD